MLLIRTFKFSVVVGAMCVLAQTGRAQMAPPAQPQVTAHGHGEIDVTPDRGEIILQVETRANDGSRAGSANAALARAVLDTLRRGFALTDRDVATIGYNMMPQTVYTNDGQPPKVTGYIASSSVRVRTAELNRVGAMIDAALAKGATGIGGLTFYAANTDEPRRRALAMAVESAKRDAEVMAVAAGGKLGLLIDIVTEPEEYVRPMPQMAFMQAAKAAIETPIQAGEQKVSARVTARWQVVFP
jgi:uncharacterized protein YggE